MKRPQQDTVLLILATIGLIGILIIGALLATVAALLILGVQ